jgi:hypothetical protein
MKAAIIPRSQTYARRMLHRALPAASSSLGYALATCTARSLSTAIVCQSRTATQHRVDRAPVRLLSTAAPSAPIPTVIGTAPPRWKHLSDFADTPLDTMNSVARSRLKRALHAFNHSQCVRPSASAPAGTFVSTAECVWMWQQLSARVREISPAFGHTHSAFILSIFDSRFSCFTFFLVPDEYECVNWYDCQLGPDMLFWIRRPRRVVCVCSCQTRRCARNRCVAQHLASWHPDTGPR